MQPAERGSEERPGCPPRRTVAVASVGPSMTAPTERGRRIEARLREALAAEHVEVVDESRMHAGHAGARPGGETHYRVLVVSPRFEGLSRVAAQRLVYDALAEELAGGLHALALRTLTPAQWSGP